MVAVAGGGLEPTLPLGGPLPLLPGDSWLPKGLLRPQTRVEKEGWGEGPLENSPELPGPPSDETVMPAAHHGPVKGRCQVCQTRCPPG